MSRKPFRKLTTLALLICMIVTTIGQPPAAHAEDEEAGTYSPVLDVSQRQVNGEYALDLSRVGNVDWLHLRGNPSDLVQVKKANSSAVTFSVYGDTGTEGKRDKGGDSDYMSYSWNDGMPGFETGNRDTGFGVFFPSKSRDQGTYENVGWNIEVKPQSQETTVLFGLGMWQAKVDVNIYADDKLVDTKQVSAGGSSQVYEFQIKVPANVHLKVEGRQTETLSQWGNNSFSGIAVSSGTIVDTFELQSEYSKVKDWTQKLYTDASWQVFASARDAAKQVIDKADASQEEVNQALSALREAQAALVKKDTFIMVDFTGSGKGTYAFGNEGDQQDRYQTFTAPSSFEMEYVQFQLKMAKEAEDLSVKLYNTDNNGLPTGTPLATTKVPADQVSNDELTTAKLNYSLTENTRYAIVLSSDPILSWKYQWIVMSKNKESSAEHFGKSVSGKFVHEDDLGTGILRIFKKSDVDRSKLQVLLEEVGKYNSKLYTVTSWDAFEGKLNNAKALYNNLDAKQSELDTVQAELQAAVNSLELSINLVDLRQQIDAISRAVVKGYTEDSVKALNQAVEAAKALGENASEQEIVIAYSNVFNAIDQLQAAGQYQYETNPKMTAAFGFEADKNASLGFLDGSYQIGGLRPEQHGPVAPKQMVTFGVTDTSDVKWYNSEGYLPAFISEYTKDDVSHKIENFANKHTVDHKDYVIDYSRVTATNHSSETRLLPVVSGNLTPLNDAAKRVYTIEPGETIIRDYVIEADKYEYFDEGVTNFTSLTREQVMQQGTFDENYNGMRTYWNTRLSDLVDIDLPNKELVNAFKAGYIYTMIIKDKTYLHVGENGYARLYSHDTLGILVTLLQSGDFLHAADYLKSIPLTGGINIETGEVDGNLYWDANWKLPWAYAVYFSKTGDASIFNEIMTADDGSKGTVFEKRIKYGARSIETDRQDGIMKKTYAIDDEGNWTIDNYAALTGLTAYEYITRELYRLEKNESYLQEAEWAKAQYEDLLAKFTARLQQTITEKTLNYLPASVVQSNDENRMRDSRDANWASMFLFGQWHWDGYLFGANQPEDNINLTMLDGTYKYGIDRRTNDGTTDSPYNFGGYPHGYYSSAYNAGYGSAALRGEAYRDMGIKAYEFMLENSMSGLFSWWEGVDYPVEGSPWVQTNGNLAVRNTPGGGGSAQHMWGQSVNSKVLLDSLIAERIYDQNQKYDIIVGRGIPQEWVENAALNNNVVANVQNYPALQGGRVGYNIERKANKLIVTLNAIVDHAKDAKFDLSGVNFSIQLPSMVDNIIGVSTGDVNNEKGIVTVPLSTKSVTITLGDLPQPTDLELDQKALEIGYADRDSNVSVTKDITLPTTGEHGSVITWSSDKPTIISNTGKVTRPSHTTEVTLTAKLQKDGAEVQKTFNVTVVASKPIWLENSRLTTTDVKQHSLTLNWTQSTDQTDIKNYKVLWGDQSIEVEGNKSVANITGLQANTSYTFRVEAKGQNDLWSDNGPTITVKTKADNGNPGNPGNPGYPGNPGNPGSPGKGNNNNNGNAGNGNNGNNNGNNGTSGNNGKPNQPKLTDIANHWAYQHILTAVERDIVKGYEDGTFRPNGNVTRSEFTVMLGRAMKFPLEQTELSFGDVSSIPAWAKPYIAYAAHSGFITGYQDKSFRPNGKITRVELVAMIARASGVKVDTKATVKFADAAQIPAWGLPYVAAAYEAGLIEGKANNKFAPHDQATRAEAVTMVLKLIQYLEAK